MSIKDITGELALFEYIRECAREAGWEEAREQAMMSRKEFESKFTKPDWILGFRVRGQNFRYVITSGVKMVDVPGLAVKKGFPKSNRSAEGEFSLTDPDSLQRIRDVFQWDERL